MSKLLHISNEIAKAVWITVALVAMSPLLLLALVSGACAYLTLTDDEIVRF